VQHGRIGGGALGDAAVDAAHRLSIAAAVASARRSDHIPRRSSECVTANARPFWSSLHRPGSGDASQHGLRNDGVPNATTLMQHFSRDAAVPPLRVIPPSSCRLWSWHVSCATAAPRPRRLVRPDVSDQCRKVESDSEDDEDAATARRGGVQYARSNCSASGCVSSSSVTKQQVLCRLRATRTHVATVAAVTTC